MKKIVNLILVFSLLFFPAQRIALAQGLHIEEVNKAVDGALEALEKLRFGPRVLPTGGGVNEGEADQNAGAQLPSLDSFIDSGNSGPSTSPLGGEDGGPKKFLVSPGLVAET